MITILDLLYHKTKHEIRRNYMVRYEMRISKKKLKIFGLFYSHFKYES